VERPSSRGYPEPGEPVLGAPPPLSPREGAGGAPASRTRGDAGSGGNVDDGSGRRLPRPDLDSGMHRLWASAGCGLGCGVAFALLWRGITRGA